MLRYACPAWAAVLYQAVAASDRSLKALAVLPLRVLYILHCALEEDTGRLQIAS